MELKIDFPMEIQKEIRNELQKGMFQTAIFLTIKQLKDSYNLKLRNCNHMKHYTLAKSVLQKKFPEYFPQMRLFQ